MKVTRAFVLAAGKGTRMRPLTDRVPKPLVEVAGRPMIDFVLDRLAAAGVEEAVVNTHHLAALVEAHLAGRARPRIRISREAALLETGGGLARALGHLGPAPFFTVNSDGLWRESATPALSRLAAAWDDAAMDALLLVHAREAAVGYDGVGDFELARDGRLARRRGDAAPFAFMGVQLLHPRLLRDAPDGAFSLNRLYDRALAAGRLHGLAHAGDWFHVGTPEALAMAERAFAAAPGE